MEKRKYIKPEMEKDILDGVEKVIEETIDYEKKMKKALKENHPLYAQFASAHKTLENVLLIIGLDLLGEDKDEN